MDLFKQSGQKYLGPGGLKCQCCDSGLSKKRKCKHGKNRFSKLRRAVLKKITQKEIKNNF